MRRSHRIMPSCRITLSVVKSPSTILTCFLFAALNYFINISYFFLFLSFYFSIYLIFLSIDCFKKIKIIANNNKNKKEIYEQS